MEGLIYEAAFYGPNHAGHAANAVGGTVFNVAQCGGNAETSALLGKLCTMASTSATGGTLANDIAATRRKVEFALKTGSAAGGGGDDDLRGEVAAMRSEMKEMKAQMTKMQQDIQALNLGKPAAAAAKSNAAADDSAKGESDEEEDIDLFGSDDDEPDEEKERIKQERLAAYSKKKATKPGLIAKSSVILDVKPWDDETDMKVVEEHVRSIQQDGLVWGAAKFVPMAYGIKKLQIICVVEDDKVSIEELTEKIEAFDDYVQSVDIAAFNKI